MTFQAVEIDTTSLDGHCSKCGTLTVFAPVEPDLCYDCACACPVHHMVEAEGGSCPECERLGQRELDLCKRVHPYINAQYLRYHINGGPVFKRNTTLRQIIWQGWTSSKEQTLLDCITMGYSLCVAKPLIDKVHDLIDADYKAWMVQDQNERLAEKYEANNTF